MFEGGECPNSCRSMKESGSTWLQGRPSGEMGLAIECRMPRGTGRSHTGKTWNKCRTLACSRQYLPLFGLSRRRSFPETLGTPEQVLLCQSPDWKLARPYRSATRLAFLLHLGWRSVTASRPQLH